MIRNKREILFSRVSILITLFVIVTTLSSLTPYFKLDILLTNKIQAINSAFFQSLMQTVSSLGNQPTMIGVVALISLILFIKKLRAEAVIASLSAVGGALSGSLLKILIDRPRPDASLVRVSVWLSDKSYPSNHVLVFTIYFGFLLYLILKKQTKNPLQQMLSITLILLISTVGISRIYLGAHWASDVVGGYLLGITWLIFTIRLYNSRNGKR